MNAIRQTPTSYLHSLEEPGPDSPQPGPSPAQPVTVRKEDITSVQTGAAIAIGVVALISMGMAAIALIVWKRIRDGNRETTFTRFFDGIARCTGYDPSGFAVIDPPDVQAAKDRNALIGMLEAHRYQHVEVVHVDNAHILLGDDSDSLEGMSESDIL